MNVMPVNSDPGASSETAKITLQNVMDPTKQNKIQISRIIKTRNLEVNGEVVKEQQAKKLLEAQALKCAGLRTQHP